MAEKAKEALFNSGIAKLERIDGLNRWYHMAMAQQDAYLAVSNLSGILSEIWEFLDNTERDIQRQTEIIVRQHVAEVKLTHQFNPYVFHDWLRTMNSLQHKYGLSMPPKPVEGSAMDV
jgi:hypothetical protein